MRRGNFWDKVNKSPYCWEWSGSRDTRKGVQTYGRLRRQGKLKAAHRYSWEITRGEIPEGLDVLHKCGNKICVNPNHLYLGTDRENQQDRKRLKENATVQPKRRKINNWQLRILRHLYKKVSTKKLSEYFQVPVRTIYNHAYEGFKLFDE